MCRDLWNWQTKNPLGYDTVHEPVEVPVLEEVEVPALVDAVHSEVEVASIHEEKELPAIPVEEEVKPVEEQDEAPLPVERVIVVPKEDLVKLEEIDSAPTLHEEVVKLKEEEVIEAAKEEEPKGEQALNRQEEDHVAVQEDVLAEVGEVDASLHDTEVAQPDVKA